MIWWSDYEEEVQLQKLFCWDLAAINFKQFCNKIFKSIAYSLILSILALSRRDRAEEK
ncbi:MAG: hypothetical protein J7527_18880 [Chitinophagaceae bacterium]|nr:hypothetical protein [Chitinophagaceae bacterium]